MTDMRFWCYSTHNLAAMPWPGIGLIYSNFDCLQVDFGFIRQAFFYYLN